jgi:hypothetical protein
MTTITNEDLKLIRRFQELKEKGFYCDSKQLQEVYNRVLNKHVAPTTCGSCMRQRIAELVAAVDKFERELSNIENKTQIQPTESTSPVEGATDKMAKARAAKKKKSDDS